jgi:hypothetical protein
MAIKGLNPAISNRSLKHLQTIALTYSLNDRRPELFR